MSTSPGTSPRSSRDKKSRHQRFNLKGSVPWQPSAASSAPPAASAKDPSSQQAQQVLPQTTPPALPLPPLPHWSQERYSELHRKYIVPAAADAKTPPSPQASPTSAGDAGASSEAGTADTGSPPTQPSSPSADSSTSSGPQDGSDASGEDARSAQDTPPCDAELDQRAASVLQEMLDREVGHFAGYMELSEAEHRVRLEVAERVASVARKLYPACSLEVFGSWSTGLCLPSSDIDFTLCGVEPSEASTLSQVLQQNGFLTHLIPASKVPLLRLADPVTGVHADISFNMSRAATSASNMRRLLKKYPLARPLIITLKSILKLGNINELYTGGLSSYSLSLMVISYLQVKGHATNSVEDEEEAGLLSEGESREGEAEAEAEASSGGSVTGCDGQSEDDSASSSATYNTANASTGSSGGKRAEKPEANFPVFEPPTPGVANGSGKCLLGFLEMFGLEAGALDFEALTISVARGTHIPKSEALCSSGNPGAQLSLEDPLCPANDVAKGTFRFMDVRMLFSNALKVLRWYGKYSAVWEARNAHQAFPYATPPPATPLLAVFGCDPREYGAQVGFSIRAGMPAMPVPPHLGHVAHAAPFGPQHMSPHAHHVHPAHHVPFAAGMAPPAGAGGRAGQSTKKATMSAVPNSDKFGVLGRQGTKVPTVVDEAGLVKRTL